MRPIERRGRDAVVGNRHVEAIAERPQILFVHLLLLVRDVLTLARLAEAVALDRSREDDRRLAAVLHGRAVRVVDLLRVVSADAHLAQVVVRQMPHHVEQARILAPEVLAQVRTVLDDVALVLAVDDLAHAAHERALGILREERIPVRAPQTLDDVPARAAEHGLELLDDLAVAAHRAVQPLQVAVDDEDQVVELLARGERDRSERFRLVGLAVAEERPDLLIGRRLEAAVLEVPRVPRLVNRHERPEAHRDRWELPELGHEPRVRVRRQPAARAQFVPEVVQMRLVEPSLEERPRVDPRRGVALVVHDVRVAAGVLAAEEMIEADLVERRRRRVGRDVAADAVRLAVRANDHRERVPPHEALDAALDLTVAGVRHFLGRRNRIDVGRRGRERLFDAGLARSRAQRIEQPHDAGFVALAQHVVERFQPFAGLDRFEGCCVSRREILHDDAVL